MTSGQHALYHQPEVGLAFRLEDRTLRCGEGISLDDLALDCTPDGQYLLIHCRHRLMAWCSACASSADVFELANGRYTLEELLKRIPAAGSALA